MCPHTAVLRRVEVQQYAMNHDGLIEYIKALVLQGKFDRNDLAVNFCSIFTFVLVQQLLLY
jgi:hypothetical protein